MARGASWDTLKNRIWKLKEGILQSTWRFMGSHVSQAILRIAPRIAIATIEQRGRTPISTIAAHELLEGGFYIEHRRGWL